MAVVAELEKDTPADTADTEASTASKSSPDDLEDAIAEYDAAVPKTESPDDGDMQKLAADTLAEYQQQQNQQQNQTDARLNELTAENAQLHQKINLEQERADFGKFTADLQSKIPAHLPEDWAETQLLAAAAKNPELKAAWDLRNSDRRAVDLELTKIERALDHLQRNPSADQRVVAALMQRGYQLGLALNAKEILRRATSEIASRANAIREIDHEVTADHYAVAQAVRGASEKAAPEPPPDFSKMTDAEIRKFTRENYGFEGGA